MRRKDNQPKIRALRAKPSYKCGYRGTDAATRCGFDVVQRQAHKVVSFFSGCGGLDLGFHGGFSFLGESFARLPFEIVSAYDFLQDAVDCYGLNLDRRIEQADLTVADVKRMQPADILIGGFPCQDFSSAGPKTGFEGKRGKLYQVLLSYMREHRPRFVLGENVIHLARMNDGQCLRTIVADFEAAGYHFDVWNLFAPDYGVPQNRRRLFFVGVRNDIDGYPVRPEPTHPDRPVTIAEAIGDLVSVTDESVPNQSQYFVSSRASSGGGQGDNVNEADKVAYCIRANARGRIQFHYSLDRRLTVRECARIQTFPDEFVFPFTTQRNLTLIGNAVPPVLGHAVAEALAKFIAAVDAGDASSGSRTMNRIYNPATQGEFDLW